MANNIVLTSCGIINEDFKARFYAIASKERVGEMKLLYITTAADGEDGEKSWLDKEFQTIIALGFKLENIVEYKIGQSDENVMDFDAIYMMGGNTFYLLDMIRKTGFGETIKAFIDAGKIYIGSSAGSEIMSDSIEPALGYDENNVGMTDYTGLGIVSGIVVPHCARKQDYLASVSDEVRAKLILLYDGDGIIL